MKARSGLSYGYAVLTGAIGIGDKTTGAFVHVAEEFNNTINHTKEVITPYITKAVESATTAVSGAAPTPKPPGLEAAIAVAGLLAVAYVVIRRKN